MLVELGNPSPTKVADEVRQGAPVVLYVPVPDDYTYTAAYPDGQTQRIGRGRDVDATSAAELALEAAAHLGRSIDGVTHIPEQEALLAVVNAVRGEMVGAPSWVWSDNADFAVLLGAFFDCPVGRPDDVEMTHVTDHGPAGVGPDLAAIEAAAVAAQANDPSPEV